MMGDETYGSRYRFSIDRGGTFTDVFAECPSGETRVCKLLSKSSDMMYADAPTEGIRRIIEIVRSHHILNQSSILYVVGQLP